MSLESHIPTILEYYYEVMSVKDFMEYYNSQPELQQTFDKVLRSSPPDGHTVTEWLNTIYLSEDVKLVGSERTKNEYLIWLFVREFLAKGKTIKYLSKQEVESLIISSVTDSGAFYSASYEVENYIKTKIMSEMPEAETLNRAIKYVKEQMKKRFKCANKMPRWQQNCEWAFDDNGEPMIFKEQIKRSHGASYVFYSETSGKEITVNQFD